MLAVTEDAGWTGADTQVLQVLANLLSAQRRDEDAASLLEYAHAREPENAEVTLALASVYLILARHDDALACADRYLARFKGQPPKVEALLVRSRALWGIGRRDEAQATMDDYLALKQIV